MFGECTQMDCNTVCIGHHRISGYEKVKMTITTQTTTMETEPLTRGIVIFGATGDLCKKKLIPALYKLWQKELAAR